MKKYNRSLFIFRRDLRLEDNTALIEAYKSSKHVSACFIFTPEQIENNPYFSNNFMNFMYKSLEELKEVSFFYGSNEDVLEDILSNNDFEAVYVNRDYTSFSKARDRSLEEICIKRGLDFNSFEDYLINEVSSVMRSSKKGDDFYKVFTPYYNAALERGIKPPKEIKVDLCSKAIKSKFSCELSYIKKFFQENPNLAVKGGREEALKILSKSFSNYSEVRNFPSKKTTMLSAHLKMGTVSIREAISLINKNSSDKELVRQIYWRDFWAYITYNRPDVVRENFYSKYDPIEWDNVKDSEKSRLFKAWQRGETGVPIIDAGMRELNETGWMHNRVRMLTASFLVKNLYIDWREGAKYFATKLVDYCPMQNQNNWQSVAGVGASSLAWFRVMNPWIQQKKFDEKCKYIYKWIPELKKLSPDTIHKWNKEHINYNIYIDPIVEHRESSDKFLKSFKEL